MKFETEAHVNEYVIDAERLAKFSASDDVLTYTRPRFPEDGPVTIPVDEITEIQFERNTTLHRYKLMGLFFVVIAFLFTAVTSIGVYEIVRSDELILHTVLFYGFLGLFTIGAWSTSYNYLQHENHDVIDIYIRTNEDVHVVCGNIKNAEFVDATKQLLNSDISTTDISGQLKTKMK